MARSIRLGLVGGCALVLVALVTVGANGRSAAAPVNTAAPTISGTPLEGNKLTGHRGTWSGSSPITYGDQWVRCDGAGSNCANISGATDTSYKLVAADLGATIRFRVTATNADGSKTADSIATGVVSKANGAPTSTKPPVVSGTVQIGSTLTTTTGSWVGATPITYSYQWQRCDTQGNACASISGAVESTYTITKSDGGKTLRSKVTGKNSYGKSSAISEPTAVVPQSGSGSGSVAAADVPADQRLVVDTVTFLPNPVSSRKAPIEVRIRVKDTRGKLVHGAYVFLRSTPILTETPVDAQTDGSGWVVYHVMPRSDFPLRTGYSVQFYVKAYRHGDPTLGGIYGSRLVQVATVTP